MAEDRYCRNCGRELRPEDRFCTNCGRPVHATAQVPTPEADVPVPPPPQPDAGSPKAAQSAAPPAPPSPQQQQPVGGRWQQFKWPILLSLGSLVIAGFWTAYNDALPGAFVGFALQHMFRRFVLFAPIWLFLGGLSYLFVRLLGKKPSFLQAIFNWPLTILIVILVLLSGGFTYLD